MAFWTEHPKWDQNPKFTPLNETTSIPAPFIWEFPRWAFHLQSARPAHVFHRWVQTVPIRYFPATKKKQQQKKTYIVTSTKVWKRILVRATCKIPYRPRNAACHPLDVLLQAFPCSYTLCIFFTGMLGNFIYTGYFLQVHLHSSTEKLTT